MTTRSLAGLAVLSLALLGAGQRPAGLGDVVSIERLEHEGHTRVVVALSRPAPYRVNRLENPPRLYLDIDGVWIEAPVARPRPQSSGPVRVIRGGQNELARARVVLELDASVRESRTFHLEAPFRIVTDVFDERVAGVGAAPPATPPPPETVRPSFESFDVRPVRRVVIDPGHGGKDPGATGAGGVREKDVVLRIARELAAELRRAGLEVYLTRERDAFHELQARTDAANRWQGDLFVSIHANASRRRAAAGVETYLLDTRYDRQTARVAARENGISVAELSELQRILASLRLGYNERFAARFADTVHASLVRSLRSRYGAIQDLGVKRGPFLVLFQADMPAILVEVGFVTNRAEGGRMATAAFAREAARGLARGILSYRDQHARSLIAGR
jgi:N-acetylmuramoyl-L-alanine amidase